MCKCVYVSRYSVFADDKTISRTSFLLFFYKSIDSLCVCKVQCVLISDIELKVICILYVGCLLCVRLKTPNCVCQCECFYEKALNLANICFSIYFIIVIVFVFFTIINKFSCNFSNRIVVFFILFVLSIIYNNFPYKTKKENGLRNE